MGRVRGLVLCGDGVIGDSVRVLWVEWLMGRVLIGVGISAGMMGRVV